jgi:hypothetical protein
MNPLYYEGNVCKRGHVNSRGYSERYKSTGSCVRCLRRTSLRDKYGIDDDNYKERLESQGGRCKICKTDNPGSTGSFHVDHCHDTGKVRGLLCHWCNIGIGCMRDCPRRLQSAIDYLIESRRGDEEQETRTD